MFCEIRSRVITKCTNEQEGICWMLIVVWRFGQRSTEYVPICKTNTENRRFRRSFHKHLVFSLDLFQWLWTKIRWSPINSFRRIFLFHLDCGHRSIIMIIDIVTEIFIDQKTKRNSQKRKNHSKTIPWMSGIFSFVQFSDHGIAAQMMKTSQFFSLVNECIPELIEND